MTTCQVFTRVNGPCLDTRTDHGGPELRPPSCGLRQCGCPPSASPSARSPGSVTQGTVWKALELHRERGVSTSPPELPSPLPPSPRVVSRPEPEPEPPAPEPPPLEVPEGSRLTPDRFYAHVVDELEQDIIQARAGSYFNAIAALRPRQVSAFEMMSTARAGTDELEGLTEAELIESLRNDLTLLPPELREEILTPQPPVVQLDGVQGAG